MIKKNSLRLFLLWKIRWKRFDYIFFCNKTFAEKFHQLIIKNLRKIVLVKQSAIICLYFDLFSN